MQLFWHRKQQTFAETLFPVYMKGNTAPLAVGDLSLPEDTHFAPFDVRRRLAPMSDPGFIRSPGQHTGGPIQSHRIVFRRCDSLLPRGSCDIRTLSLLTS